MKGLAGLQRIFMRYFPLASIRTVSCRIPAHILLILPSRASPPAILPILSS
jgi:predicted regulator of amino acid metabolism with ACT domain